MILYVWQYQNSAFVKIAVIDYAKSVIWIERYNKSGEFELYLRASENLLKLFSLDGLIITRDAIDTAMIADTVKLSTDAINGDYITVTGKTIDSVLGYRIFPKQKDYSGTAENVIRQMITDNVINPAYSDRQMNFVMLADSNGWEETLEKQVTGKNLLDTISDICISFDYGYKMTFSNGNFVFNLYKGADRSFSQSVNPYVVFSPQFENLGNTEYSKNKNTYFNSVYVAGEGEGSDRIILEVNDELKKGLFLREKWVDAKTISSTTEGGTLRPTEYLQLLADRGREELKITQEVTSFSGEILNLNSYRYGIDYFLGDKIQIETEYGMTGIAQITEITEVEDDTGYKIYPTLSEWGD